MSIVERGPYLGRPTGTILCAKGGVRRTHADSTQAYMHISTWRPFIGFICTVAHVKVIEAQLLEDERKGVIYWTGETVGISTSDS
jgi:hypothetical protein